MKILSLILLFAAPSAMADVQDPCLSTEHWNLNRKGSSPAWLREFHEFSAKRSQGVQAFAQAVQLKRISSVMGNSAFEEDFSEYWVARVLFDLKLMPLSYQAFSSVFENTENRDLKKAAYSCMTRIQMVNPDFRAPDLSGVSQLSWTEADSDVLLLNLIGKDSPLAAKLSPGHKGFLTGVNSLKNRKYSEAIQGFTAYFKYLQTHPGSFVSRYQDQAHLMMGRALYATARFKESADEFQKVRKTSNEQIEALSNLAWAYLLQEKYDDAIGVALQLRSGGLRHTFAPEPIMVSAMALNELCIYPESIRMVQAFVKDYLSSFNWLKKNPNRPDGYDLTLKAIKNVQVAPSKLTTEWIRRPEFLTRQTEINEMIAHPRLIAETESKAYTEQVRMTKEWVSRAASFIQEVKVANLKLKSNQTLAPEFADRYATLKRDHRKLSQFYRASRVWKTLARNYEKRLPGMRAELVKRVNADFNKKNQKLLAMLRNVRDNSDLIEVEIYNGASQDIVWKNAHPEFEAKKDELLEEKSGPDHSETWSWGRFLASDIENSEVWEDELGALKADVQSQCNAKEKFLKLSLMKREK
ncbi:MAG: hypothetical protein KGP28_09745 [Bdellovibrionales bacterium]|nr:hypothetical protein [Bdellovibrionales bacterium]